MRRMLLARRGSTLVPPDPPDGGGGETPSDPNLWLGWPATSDPILQSFRPHGRRVAVRSVGIPGATNADLNEAATASKVAATEFGLGGKGFWDGAGPDYRYDVLIGPGTYNGSMGGGQWGCYIGTTGDPEDVILQADDGSNGVLHSFGPQYLEGLTLRAYTSDGDESPKYPWHITGGPVTIAANCVFDVSDAIDGGGNRTAGVVGKDSSVLTIFYRCTFRATPGVADGFNMHGAPTPGDLAETAIFLDCTTEGVASIGSTGNVSSTGDLARLYVIGLTHDEHLVEIGADANAEVYTDTDLPVGGSPAAVFRDVTDWAEVVDGLLPELAAYYYPSALPEPSPVDQTIPVDDASPMAPVPGRTYFVRIRQEEALRARASGFTCTVAAGEYGIAILPADTPYVRDEPVKRDLVDPGSLLTVGTVVHENFYAYTRYPGDNGIWVKVAFDNAAARVLGSASLPGLTDCAYSDDGTTLVTVSEGTPHPIVFVRGN